MKQPNILVVDDAADVLAVVADLLRMNDYEVTEAAGGEPAVASLARQRFDMILTDLEMPSIGGMDVLAEAKRRDPDVPVVLITAYSTIERAVEAMRQGAFDFLAKPVRSEDLLNVVERALERRPPVPEPEPSDDPGSSPARTGEPPFIAHSPGMARVMSEVDRVAASDTTVLLLGESGTGKEMLSRIVHARSPRRDAPLVVINCAAIPGELMENELFGSERGAFTGAQQRKPGKFELAENGSILLDEIGDLNLSLQAKLLRVLEQREFERLGGTRTIPLNVRVMAASNRELSLEVEAGRFREDLFYRLNVFPITLPPLRDRREDVPDLVRYFVGEMSRELGKPIRDLTPQAMKILETHDWPGNVRELRNVIERSVLLCDEPVLGADHVVIQVRARAQSARISAEDLSAENLRDVSRMASAKAEIEMILKVMEEVRWNRRKAAQRLGVSYKTLWNKLKEYGLG